VCLEILNWLLRWALLSIRIEIGINKGNRSLAIGSFGNLIFFANGKVPLVIQLKSQAR
jgi:hypothetical protein